MCVECPISKMVSTFDFAGATCKNNDPAISHFTFSKEEDMMNKWMTMCDIPPLMKMLPKWTVCIQHFSRDDFSSVDEIKKPEFKQDAIPSIKINLDLDNNISTKLTRTKNGEIRTVSFAKEV